MRVSLGLDIGGSTTKIVANGESGRLLQTRLVEAGDQLTSLYGAVGGLLQTCGLSLGDVTRIAVTGVGAALVGSDVFGIPVLRVPEFQAIGRGGLLLSGFTEALVVSMGTGTAFVRADKNGSAHVGGSGVGGGMLLGLSSRLFGERDIRAVTALAERGDLQKVDLSIGEISCADIPTLPPLATAANFGRVESDATGADMALGLLNAVFQTVGTLAAFACRDWPVKNVVVTGSLATLPKAQPLLDEVGALYDLRFTIPEKAAFATAIGAAGLLPPA